MIKVKKIINGFIEGVIILVISTIFVMVSVFIPVKADNIEEYDKLEFGFPVGFIIQDRAQTPFEYLGDFPHYFSFLLGGPNYTVRNTFLIGIFTVSVLIVYVILRICYRLLYIFLKRNRFKA